MECAPSLLKGYSDDALLEEVRRVAGLVEGPLLTRADSTKRSGLSADAVRQRFGKWKAVLQRAGVGQMYAGSTEEAGRSAPSRI